MGMTRARAGTARRRGRVGAGCWSRGAGRAGDPARGRRPSRPRAASLGGRGNGGKNQMHSAGGGWGGARTSPSRPRPRGRSRWPGVPPWRRTRSSRRRTCRPTRARATSRDSFRALFQVGQRALRGPIPRTCRRVSGVARRSRAATFARRGFRRATRPERGEDGFARRVVRRDARRRDGSARRRSRRGTLGTSRQSVLGPTRIASRATRLNAHTRPSGGPHHENLPAKPRPGSAWETLRTRVSSGSRCVLPRIRRVPGLKNSRARSKFQTTLRRPRSARRADRPRSHSGHPRVECCSRSDWAFPRRGSHRSRRGAAGDARRP